ncbi:hypothetical protein [Moorena sp. SIO4G3]|uniref:hypothetical protein n=1 Tax=Moorena sp. SIO4G3 TaxID=2607821 RepID=UPI00142B1BA4|nr:hypothetical protein [Moorena sp. SIO4G3]NEO79008.1 hypothetical protein [Moorena sp. SIO4G3]
MSNWRGFPHSLLHQDKAQLSYGNYRLWRRLAVGHAKGEREQTMSDCIKKRLSSL